MAKKHKKWGLFSGLFNRSQSELELSEVRPEVEAEPEDGFVIEESDERVVKVEESTSDVFVIEPSLKEYKVLEVDEDISDELLKKKYRLLVKEHHPDNGGDPKQFMKIQKAYKKIMEFRNNN
jgi:DnaJ-domain-containing protein 1